MLINAIALLMLMLGDGWVKVDANDDDKNQIDDAIFCPLLLLLPSSSRHCIDR
jgi:hypothetical protein